MNALFFYLLFAVSGGYFSQYSAEAGNAMDFYKENIALFKEVFAGASDSEIKMAFSVVAPEVSQYDAIRDYVEKKAVGIKYVRNGECDYSIGYFQMKPSFVESLEKEVFKDRVLAEKYGKLFEYSRKNDERAVRKERFDRLCNTKWQIRYLSLFIDVVKKRTSSWGLSGNGECLRFWATMYNAGFYLSKARVKQRQTVRQFPRSTAEFNYSSVALEFYKELCR